jgi:hypothetical protein
MKDTNDGDAKPVAAKSIDPAALEMLAHADECGIETDLQSCRRHEALPDRRKGRLLSHLQHGAVSPGG